MGYLGLILKAAFQHTDPVLELQYFFKIMLLDKQTNQMNKVPIPTFSPSLVSCPDPLPVEWGSGNWEWDNHAPRPHVFTQPGSKAQDWSQQILEDYEQSHMAFIMKLYVVGLLYVYW